MVALGCLYLFTRPGKPAPEELKNGYTVYDDEINGWGSGSSGSGSYSVTNGDETKMVASGVRSARGAVAAGTAKTVWINILYTPSQKNWSDYGYMGLFLYGNDSDDTFYIRIIDSAVNSAYYPITDNFSGWKWFILNLGEPSTDEGIDWTDIWTVRIQVDPSSVYTFYVDKMIISRELEAK